VEYHKYVSELEVALDRYMYSRCRLLHRSNYHRKGEEQGHDVVHKRMEVEYYRARSQNHHLEVVWLIRIISFLCSRDGGE